MTKSVQQILKEKKQKKNNKATGQFDKLLGYDSNGKKSSDKSALDDKLIRREAKYLKNIAIDKAFEDLLRMNVVTNDQYRAFWCGTMHKLGVSFVMAQAHLAIKTTKNEANPGALFHFLINKELNKRADPYGPRTRGLRR